MIKKLAAGAGALALAGGVALVAPAAAAPKDMSKPMNDGAYCVQQGIGTLKSLGALQAAAQGKVDYSAFADATTGPIFLDMPEGTFLSLGTVVKLHTTNPELFAWCAR
jgi:hypothetical protein